MAKQRTYLAHATVLLLILCGVGIFAGFSARPNLPQEEMLWTSADGPPPRQFCYLVFPAGPEVQLPPPNGDGDPIPLKRAFLCSLDELQRKRPTVIVGEHEFPVPGAEWTLLPDHPAAAEHVEAWRQLVATLTRSETEWPVVDASWTEIGEKTYRVTVELTDWDKRRTRFVYTVSPHSVKPEKWSEQGGRSHLGK